MWVGGAVGNTYIYMQHARGPLEHQTGRPPEPSKYFKGCNLYTAIRSDILWRNDFLCPSFESGELRSDHISILWPWCPFLLTYRDTMSVPTIRNGCPTPKPLSKSTGFPYWSDPCLYVDVDIFRPVTLYNISTHISKRHLQVTFPDINRVILLSFTTYHQALCPVCRAKISAQPVQR
jgi:hypothetical protein